MADDHWRKAIDTLELDLNETPIRITANELRQTTEKDPRLLTYIDSFESLPDVLKAHEVFPIAIENGVYLIVKGKGFHELEQISCEPLQISFDLEESLATLQTGSGEDKYLFIALHSGILAHFVESDELIPTSIGRKRGTSFSFRIGTSPWIEVKGIQFQVDLLLESKKEIIIIEAKARESKSFAIRQLYYPYRHWSEVLPTKKIRLIFFTYNPSEENYNLREYRFKDMHDLESIVLVKSNTYTLQREDLSLEKLLLITPESLDNLPKTFQIPQANDILKVRDFPNAVAKGVNTSTAMALHFEFDKRQSSYYRDAAQGLGLVILDKNHRYQLTELGEWYVTLSEREQNHVLIRRLMKHPILSQILIILSKDKVVTKKDIVHIIIDNSNLSGSTIPRRASTIYSWFKWFAEVLGIIIIEDGAIKLGSQLSLDI